MFKLFRRKSVPKKGLEFAREKGAESLDDQSLIGALLQAVRDQPPVVCAHFLIAYENLFIIQVVFAKLFEGGTELSSTLENLARYLNSERGRFTSASIEDEASSRRFTYFYLATLLRIAQQRAALRPSLWDSVADVWVALMPGALALRKTIDSTVLWSSSEVQLFAEVASEQDGEEYCLSHVMPSELRLHKKIDDWLWRNTPPQVRKEMEDIIEQDMAKLKGSIPDES